MFFCCGANGNLRLVPEECGQRVSAEASEHLEDGRVSGEEIAVAGKVGAGQVIAGGALEAAAVGGAVVVDGAEVVRAEELTAAVAVGEDGFEGGALAGLDGDLDGEGGEFAAFVGFEEDGIVVAVLFAAGGEAEVTGAVAEDSEAEGHGVIGDLLWRGEGEGELGVDGGSGVSGGEPRGGLGLFGEE